MTKIIMAAVITGSLMLPASGAFNDDFSNDQVSNNLWARSADYLAVEFPDQTCMITNSSPSYIGIARHTFPENERPSTFTLSGKVTLGDSTMTAGFAVCIAPSGMATGYYISISQNDQIGVNKIGSSGTGSVIVSVTSAYLIPGTNVLKISRNQDGMFKISCNGQYAAEFTDMDFTSGDIGLLVSTGSIAVFDDIVMTDSFEDINPPTCFTDDFDNGIRLGWDTFGSGDASVNTEHGGLHITTDNGQELYQVFDLPLDSFNLRATVSHRGRSSFKLYGLFLCGKGEETIPITGFGINGGGNYGVFMSGESVTPVPSAHIKGDPFVSQSGDTTYYVDTLQVIRHDGGNECIFIVNDSVVTKFTGVNFDVTGAGIFCFDSLDVIFDDFLVTQGTGGICPVRQPVPIAARRPDTFSPLSGDLRLFDLSGRLVGGNGRNIPQGRGTAGIFIRRSGELNVQGLYRR